ncbi:DUF4221 family protein [Raineya orbicola]|uniref:DUF4221 domain-containing protein n=1 Tax=Raineya orbicola TaxID=2016530 RepID=A0A2N3I8U9_9BACT|nr:DUF4221 family protein [Raineya orbicola]PKQ66751.1 hypothetical protein Rain11_2280 [Raineya orbicola]
MKKFFLIIVIHFVSACTLKEAKEQNFRNKISVQKTLSIPLDSLTPQYIFNPQLIKEKELVFLNSKINSLDFYSIEDKRLIKRIKFAKEGENAVGKIYQFLYHNADSIFVVNSYQYKVFLIDETGKVKEKYSLIKQKKHSATTAMPAIFPFNHSLILESNKLHIASSPDDDPYKDSFYQRKGLCIILNLKTKEFAYAMEFPKIYKDKYFATPFNFFSRIFLKKENKFVYSFLADKNIQITDMNHNLIEGKELDAPHFIEIPSLKKRIIDSQENTNAFNQNARYAEMYYNPFTDEYYRGVEIPLSKDNKSKVYLAIFDKNFNNIGEVLIYESDKLTYNLLNAFFTSEGMWIQRITDNEDELVYDLVEFVSE